MDEILIFPDLVDEFFDQIGLDDLAYQKALLYYAEDLLKFSTVGD